MSQPMKGLVQFIADLRNARAREAEVKRVNQELANIRQKFRDSSLNGYNKKKYVCKLIYMYILGYEIDFGHAEAASLLGSNKYSEKQVGYLSISLMLNENSPLLDMVLNSIRKDLQSLDDLHTCMALNCVATVGGITMAHALGDEVFKLLISPTSPNFVRKKAALTILRLYRKDPAIMSATWPDRIVALIDDPDLGVATSVSSLVIALAQDFPDSYNMSYGKVVRRLNSLVFDKNYPSEYLYYEVPSPWLYIKLFRLLQYYPPTQDETLFDVLRKVIYRVIEVNSATARNIQQNNAQNAVLFEAINLAVHLDVDPNLLDRIVEALGEFLKAPETNVRYLALSAMTNLAARYEDIPIKKYLVTILHSLKDRDISVRRKAIDLLYSLCDSGNVKTIVSELLQYLQAADFAIREEMVIRIAVLVERYAVEYEWYIDITLKLIAVAGNHVSDEVWHRVIQIVVNNEGLQVYAARTIMPYLKAPTSHETMVKIGGYILGEYGHLVAEEDGFAPIDQFLTLHDKFSSSSPQTRILLLTTYIKFVNLFAEIRPQLLQVFEFYSTSYDSELQQRACEYLRLANFGDASLLAAVWDEVPPFPERTSRLLTKMHSKYSHSEDKRVWAIGNKKAQGDKQTFQLDASGPVKRHLAQQATGAGPALGGQPKSATSSTTSLTRNGTVSSEKRPPPPVPRKSSSTSVPNGANGGATPAGNLLSSGWEIGFRKLLTHDEGMFYQDSLIQIGVKSEYRRHLGCVILYFKNISGSNLQSISVEVSNPAGDDAAHVTTKNLPDSSLDPGAITEQVVLIDAKAPFSDAPRVKITYLAGTLKLVNLQLPVVMDKFMEPAPIDKDSFFNRWDQLNGQGLEVQKVFKNLSASTNEPLSKNRSDDINIMKALNWSIVEGVGKNPTDVAGASIVHTSTGGNFGCLARLEPNSSRTAYRITVRATDDRVPLVLAKTVMDLFQL